MAYTWEEVMMGIDVRNEQKRKAEHKRKVEAKQKKESSAAGFWKTGLSLLGGAVFGPAGYFIGKQLGEYGADIAHDWESMEMEEGKFDVSGAKQFNRTLKEAAKDQTHGQVLNTVLDLGKMYVQAGGLKATPGESLDFTTFGHGGVEGGEWSVFGKGTPETTRATGLAITTPASADYVPSLWNRDASLLSNVGSALVGGGKKMIGQDQSITSVSQLAQTLYEGE